MGRVEDSRLIVDYLHYCTICFCVLIVSDGSNLSCSLCNADFRVTRSAGYNTLCCAVWADG